MDSLFILNKIGGLVGQFSHSIVHDNYRILSLRIIAIKSIHFKRYFVGSILLQMNEFPVFNPGLGPQNQFVNIVEQKVMFFFFSGNLLK